MPVKASTPLARLSRRAVLGTAAMALGIAALKLSLPAAAEEPRIIPAPTVDETAAADAPQKVAVLAGGCFWGMEDLIRRQPGVLDTRVGYTGGSNDHATYRSHPGHAEAVEIVFDPTKTTYRDILAFFFQIHDPSTLNRQGNDIGTSYRSAIFPLTPEQEAVARDTIADVDASGLWPGKAVTTIEPEGPFWEAEPEHQDYLIRYPNGYTCHFPRAGWVLPKRDA